MYETASNSSDATLTKEAHAKDLLKIALMNSRWTYIIIDGLDECSREDRKMISSYFQSVTHSIPKKNLGTLRCLFVSQDDGYARKDLGGGSPVLRCRQRATGKILLPFASTGTHGSKESSAISMGWDLASRMLSLLDLKVSSLRARKDSYTKDSFRNVLVYETGDLASIQSGI